MAAFDLNIYFVGALRSADTSVAACHAEGAFPLLMFCFHAAHVDAVQIDADRGAALLFLQQQKKKSGHVGCLLFGGADWLHQRRNLFKPHRPSAEEREIKILFLVEKLIVFMTACQNF